MRFEKYTQHVKHTDKLHMMRDICLLVWNSISLSFWFHRFKMCKCKFRDGSIFRDGGMFCSIGDFDFCSIHSFRCAHSMFRYFMWNLDKLVSVEIFRTSFGFVDKRFDDLCNFARVSVHQLLRNSHIQKIQQNLYIPVPMLDDSHVAQYLVRSQTISTFFLFNQQQRNDADDEWWYYLSNFRQKNAWYLGELL